MKLKDILETIPNDQPIRILSYDNPDNPEHAFTMSGERKNIEETIHQYSYKFSLDDEVETIETNNCFVQIKCRRAPRTRPVGLSM